MNIKRNAFFNTWGVLIYFFCQWLLTVITTRIAGYEATGRLSLAISFVNIFSFIGTFGIRGIQVSDVAQKYSDGQYYALRIVTCIMAAILFFAALFFAGHSMTVSVCCIAMMLYKMAECFSDVTLGAMQRREQFGWVAVSYTLRGILPVVAFTALLLLGSALPVAIGGMTLAFVACYLSFDVPRVCSIPRQERKLCLRGTQWILQAAMPLMLSSLLDSVMVYIPRDAVERIYGSEALGYYSTVSIITVVFSTLATGVWGSITPQISTLLLKKEYGQLKGLIRGVFLIIAAGSVCALIFGNLLGPFVFGIVFGAEILDYMYLLTPVLMNSILLLVNSFFQCLFIPMQKRAILLYTNVVALSVCGIVSSGFTEEFGLMGACFGLTLSLFLRVLLLTLVFVAAWKNKEMRTDHE